VHFAQTVQRQAFPELTLPLDFIYLHSRRRSFRQFRMGGRNFVVVDRGLSELLTLQDFLVIARGYDPDDGLAVMQVPFAEAFRHHGEVERALLCAEASHDQRARIHALRVALVARPGNSGVGLALLLHEIAHFLVDGEHPSVAWLLSRVRNDLEQHGEIVTRQSARLLAGDLLADVDSSIASMAPEDRDRLARQMREMVVHVRANTETLRETCCDVMAVLGLLTMHFGTGIRDPAVPPPQDASLREALDAVFLGLRASRQLMVKAFLAQTAENIARDADPSRLETAMSQITARDNVGTNIARGLAEGLAEKWRLHRGEDAEAADLVARFGPSIAALSHNSTERIMRAIERTGLFHRDAALYAGAVREMKHRQFGMLRPSRADLVRAQDRLFEGLPF
jgi:hypothetical protein